MPFLKLINAVEDFENETDKILLDLFKEREELATSLNVDDQLHGNGIDSQGQKITPPYAESTKKKKRREGKTSSHVTTRDKGDFHNSIVYDYRESEVAFGNDDPKFRYLTDRYGKHLLGLTIGNIAIVAEDMNEDFLNEARKKILG
jgi:hypothetical protein